MSNETIDQQLPPNQKIEINSYAVKFGIIGGLISIIISLTLFFTGMELKTVLKWLPTVAMIAIIILGLKSVADENKNREITFGTLFKTGMIITTIIAIISIVYFLVYINFIDTGFIEKVLDASRVQMAEKGLGEEQIDNAIEMTKKFMSPGIMVAFSLIGNLVFGAVTSLIGAGIFKKEK